MPKINTVLGPVDAESLGLTLPHEHIVASYPGWECDPLARPVDFDRCVGICLKNLEPLKEFGVNAIIDATPGDLSRDVDIMKAVSEKLQMHVVCSTGRYTQSEGKWAYLMRRKGVGIGDIRAELYDGLMKEITDGIGRSGIKPGVIKIASGLNSFAFCEEAMFMAAARASRETGVPVITHTEDGTMGPEQADLLIAEGVDPWRISIGHMCGNRSVDYHIDVLRRGVYIAMDRFGIEMTVKDSERIELLVKLIGIGYGDHIMISQDCFAASYGRGGNMPVEEAKKFRNWSFTNIFRNIIPELKRAGINDEQIKKMMTDNPRRFLSGE